MVIEPDFSTKNTRFPELRSAPLTLKDNAFANVHILHDHYKTSKHRISYFAVKDNCWDGIGKTLKEKLTLSQSNTRIRCKLSTVMSLHNNSVHGY